MRALPFSPWTRPSRKSGAYTAKTDDDFDALMDSPATDLRLWRTLSYGDEIVGVITSEASPPVGLIQELSVGKTWRRRGFGRTLLLAGLLALREQGLDPRAAHLHRR